MENILEEKRKEEERIKRVKEVRPLTLEDIKLIPPPPLTFLGRLFTDNDNYKNKWYKKGYRLIEEINNLPFKSLEEKILVFQKTYKFIMEEEDIYEKRTKFIYDNEGYVINTKLYYINSY